MPASSLLLLLATLAIVTVVPRQLWHQFLSEIIASTLQAENWLLAHNAVDYLASTNTKSPTQHFWTLSTEEQFYVGLPVLMLTSIALSRATRLPARRLILGALMLTVAGSLAYSVRLTTSSPGVAYFSTFTRAWEFGAGGLLAFVRVQPRRARWLDVLPWIGIAGIGAACLLFGSTTPIPGYSAALPVVAAVLAIWSGRATTLDRVGAFPPVALLGRVSYAAYLWHWPMIVLLPYATGHPLTTIDKIGIFAATIAVAWASTTFVEDPVRFKSQLLGGRRPRVVAAWCGGAMAVVVTFAALAANNETTHERQLKVVASAVLQHDPRCLGAQAIDPAFAPCVNSALDGVLVPAPATAREYDANRTACWGSANGHPKVCGLGVLTGYTKRLFAIGDSHNNNLIGVYEAIALRNHWRIDVAGDGGCYLTTALQMQPSQGEAAACNRWRAQVTQIARDGHYDAILVTHSRIDRPVLAQLGLTSGQATVRGLVQAWDALPDIPIIAIVDNPAMPPTILTCVSTHLSDAATACAETRARALSSFDGSVPAAQQVSRVRVVDMTSFYCTETLCSPVIGHVLVYRDNSHITSTYEMTLVPYFDAKILAVLAS